MLTDDHVLSEVAQVCGGLQLLRSVEARIRRIKEHKLWFERNDLEYKKAHVKARLRKYEGFRVRLVNNPLMEPPPYIRRHMAEIPITDELYYLFETTFDPDYKRRSKYKNRMMALMRNQTAVARAGEINCMLHLELAYREYIGWYLLMDSLTVRPEEMENVFYKNNKPWKDYIRRIRNDVGRAIFGSKNKFRKSGVPHSDIHTYCAVVERGDGAGERLHIHVVHAFKKPPDCVTDPNSGEFIPYKREISGFKRYWNSGWSTPITVRLSRNDAYAKLGHKWPVEPDGNNSWRWIDTSEVGAVAGYMADYLVQGYQHKEKGPWRTKTSRQLGKVILARPLRGMSLETIKYLTTIQTTNGLIPKIAHKEISPRIIRLLSLKELLSRMQKLESWQKVNSSLRQLEPQIGLMRRIEAMEKGHMMDVYGDLNFMCIETRKSKRMAISEAGEAYAELFSELGIGEVEYVGD